MFFSNLIGFFLPFGYSPALFKTLPEGAQLFPYQMTKIFYICKRIFFAISNFAIIEEVISYLKDGWLYVLLLFLLGNTKKLFTILLSSNPIQDTKLCLIRKLYNSCQSKSFQILCKFCKCNI